VCCDGLGGHLAKALTDLLIEPYLRCYRYGCSLDGTGVECVLEMNLNAPKQDKHRTRNLRSQKLSNCSIALPVEECIAQQTRDLRLILQTQRR
jgi:hypothetical protein